MAKKMILMDPRLLEMQRYTPPDAITDNLRELDSQMQQVLESENLSFDEKATLYNQTLQRYLTRLAQYKTRPLGLVDIKPPTQPTSLLKEDPQPEQPQLQTPPKGDQTRAEPVTPKTPQKTKYKLRSKKSKIPTPKWETWKLN